MFQVSDRNHSSSELTQHQQARVAGTEAEGLHELVRTNVKLS